MSDSNDNNVGYPFFHGLLAAPNCTGCPLEGSKQVFPEGNPRATVAIVGESPGYMEVQEGRVFVGPSGQMLDRLIRRAGGVREQFWITNAALCRPRTVNRGNQVLNPEQTMKLAAEHCRTRLLEELRIVRPVSIVGLGAHATHSVYDPKASMKGRRGGIHEVDLAAQQAGQGLVNNTGDEET